MKPQKSPNAREAPVKRMVLAIVLVVVATVFAMQAVGASAETMTFTGAVVMPAGGAHPIRPVVSRQMVVQTIRKTDFRVLEIIYR
ncbi:MAG: hypothetical protein EPN36_00580 [Rhodanobacteraceae bacterium]|nr:MAG: hypothetical protein EPN36_00580 [Rhodanobacteraceae bacterium]